MEGKQFSAIAAGITILAGLSAGAVFAAESKAAQSLPVAGTKQMMPNDALKDATFVGSQSCAPCHKKDHGEWKQTWHANMYRVFNPAIVTANLTAIARSGTPMLKQSVSESPATRRGKTKPRELITITITSSASAERSFTRGSRAVRG